MASHTPIPHLVTYDEVQQMAFIGAKVSYGKIDYVKFLAQHFPNLDIAKLATEIWGRFAIISTPPSKFIITFSQDPDPTIQISYNDANEDDFTNGLMFSRTFTNTAGEISVEHDYFVLPETHRNKGIATIITKSLFQQYLNMGIKRIRTFAALGSGGYTWAIMGFYATSKPELEVILAKAKDILNGTQFAFVKQLFDDFYDAHAIDTPFPIYRWAEIPAMKPVLMGSTWHGEVNFENKNQMHIFRSYVE
jgi:hypothetical protein